MYQKTIIQFLIGVAALALHRIFFEPAYVSYLEAQGLQYGYGEAFLGFAAVMLPAMFFAWFLTRPMKKVTKG